MEFTDLRSPQQQLADLVYLAHTKGIPQFSFFAGFHQDTINKASSLGLISTMVAGHFTEAWHPTIKGLIYLDDWFNGDDYEEEQLELPF